MAESKAYRFGAVLLLIHLIFLVPGTEAASFQRNQLLQKEPDLRLENVQKFPSPEMIRALEYIEKLRQQAHREESSPDYNPYQGISVPLQLKENGEESHLAESSRDVLSEDEWMRIILEALRQAENEPPSALKENKPYALNLEKNFPVDTPDDYETQQWPERKLKHMRFPLMYEENSRENPFKRTNEIVEEQYTPQSLATLESVFQELGKLTGPSNQKRERVDEEQKLYTDDEDDVYKTNNIAYEDVVGGEDWSPMEEKIETQTQEEVRDSKENTEKNEQINEEMKRSGHLGLPDEGNRKESKDQLSEDASKVITYLRRLVNAVGSGRSQSGQNGDRAARLLERPLDSQSIYQLIEISRNLQIPPEDLIEMLKAGEKPNGLVEPEQDLELAVDLDDIPEADIDRPDMFQSKTLSKGGYPKAPGRGMMEALPDGLSVEDILNVLGMENVANQKSPYFPNQYSRDKALLRLPYGPGKSRANQIPKVAWIPDVESRQAPYDNLNDKDQELGEYLARMLVKYPELMNTNQLKRVPSPGSSEDDLQEEEQLEQAIKEHLGQGSSQEMEKLAKVSKRIPAGSLKNEDTPNRQYLDEDMLLKVLEYLNQEQAEQGREHLAKRAMENM
ncbi:secretogranin 2, isoform CRA_a [Rattus norvegicus]|uniref:Secretogranin-2 n=2 Tax=Rattus norvegicus TaxID=10116 RepID=A0A8I6A821_RAT|nr:secretogranin-2 precursor [Rattus norvegicus]XP_008765417.1 secretogranin-2 isoform X1 [Rattus norvegicus]EDL75479.1 secretogranin 2, isoform CRA_a [Rattus norvegicus]EDL75480.1 secretogranin 2, isoform CRA_a [Rattus norvegicus]EDL75481.1 secretogranin 2, isoform CRA_a [Rattus norvegicus]|eukprot:XP_008765417.1 PREDICTED: secretogranin-2 isoform X1 [Rattus norvegicus]